MQLASSRVFEKTTSNLYKIVQHHREPLHVYLTRFNREKVTITNCDIPTAIETFRRGLDRESPLFDELTKYPCRTMDGVQAKAMAQEERVGWKKDTNLPPPYDNYGFTIIPSAMMKEFTKLGDIVKWTMKNNKPKANPDSKLWCDYQGDYGHKTYDCVALRKELQFLTKKAYLTKFMTFKKMAHVRRERSPNRYDIMPMRQPPPPHHKVINFIGDESEVCGSTYSQAKRVARETDIRVTQVGIDNRTLPLLTFDESDKRNIREPQQNGLFISLLGANCLIKRILVDNGSSANIMMLSTLKQMGLEESDMINKITTLTIPSIYHEVLKFPTPWGAQEIRGDQDRARECYGTFLKPTAQYHGNETHVANVTGPEKLAEVDLKIGDKKALIGEDLSPSNEANLVNLLTTRLDAFAWEHNDIMRIDHDIITHKLNYDPTYVLIQQKKRKFAAERNKIINDEIDRL
ncbi:uncharacterized protein LOC141718576 [Apium graveolens]|uniref:uncharacterized protein LOC141718576 n=1 Tax=Apium graveolens TaxID=4045 RepID=UPI003D79C6DF